MSEYIIKASDWAIDYKGESLFKGCEEIVRCKDCRLQDDGKYCERLGFKVGDYGYCAWPIRKD